MSVTSGFTGDPYADSSGGAGGGGGGGGAGGGAGAGGSLGQLVQVHAVVTLPDGTLVGEADTDQTGMVTLNLCGYTGPLLVTFSGQPNGTYYDEGKQAYVPFITGTIHAYVPSVTKNIGVTPFTEAAYQFLLATGGAVANGSPPGGPAEKAGPVFTAQQIQAANERIRTVLNQSLQAGSQIDDITRLPVIVGGATAGGSIAGDKFGNYALVNAAFSKQAASFNPAAATPTLLATQHLAQDLSDGLLDGLKAGLPLSITSDKRTYDPAQLTTELNAALGLVSSQYGNASALNLLPPLVSYGNCGYGIYSYDAQLAPDGSAKARVRSYTTVPSPTATQVGQTEDLNPAGTKVLGIYPNVGNGSLFLKLSTTDSSSRIFGIGNNSNGELGIGNRNQQLTVVEVPALAGLTHVAGGFGHNLARLQDGSVKAWGDNAYSQLGQGNTGGRLLTPTTVTLPAPALTVAAGNVSSFALLTDGRVFSWGSAWGFGALGDGSASGVRVSPAAVKTATGDLTNVFAISARDNNAVVLRKNGTATEVWSWGSFPVDGTGRRFATQTTGFPAISPLTGAPSPIRKVLTEDGLFAALFEDGLVYTWGDYFDPVADKLLQDRTPVRVLNLPPIRDLMYGGFRGYDDRAFDRVTAMAIDFNGNLWRIRGRVAEFFDPANPQARPPIQVRDENCASCHNYLPFWPLNIPPSSSTTACVPPHGASGKTDCTACHNGLTALGGEPVLTCAVPTFPPFVPSTRPAACQPPVPPSHQPVPTGGLCGSCHNDVIHASLNTTCPAVTVTAVLKTDAQGNVVQSISNGGTTDDATPSVTGTLSRALFEGEHLRVSRNGSVVFDGPVTGTTWTVTDNVTPAGMTFFTVQAPYIAEMFAAPGTASPAEATSTTFTVTVQVNPPPRITTVTTITNITDNLIAPHAPASTGSPTPQTAPASVANGGTTDDITPTLTITVSAGLSATQRLKVFRGGQELASLAPIANALTYTYTDTPNPPYTGAGVTALVSPTAGPINVGYTARVIDTTDATNLGPQSTTYNIVLNYDQCVPPTTQNSVGGVPFQNHSIYLQPQPPSPNPTPISTCVGCHTANQTNPPNWAVLYDWLLVPPPDRTAAPGQPTPPPYRSKYVCRWLF